MGGDFWRTGRRLAFGGAVAFAKARGYGEIALFGTSLGGPRIALFMATKGDASIRAVGFIASIKSPYLEFQIRASESERARLDAFLAKARELGDHELDHLGDLAAHHRQLLHRVQVRR